MAEDRDVAQREEIATEREENATENGNGGALGYELLAEFFGVFLLILIGNGAVVVSVTLAGYDLFGVAVAWALAIGLAIYGTGAISGAHFNPAVTITLATFAGFQWRKVGPYIGAQFLGAFVASAAIYLSFGGIIAAYEASQDITRGESGSQLTGMFFTTYAPNPALVGTGQSSLAQVSHPVWFFTEALMTAILLFGIFYIIEESNEGRPLANLFPMMIGLLVGILIMYGGPVTMTALNPARDLAPRIFAFLTGWGPIAFPGPGGGWWIPTVATIVGGLVGGAIYHLVYKRGFPKPAPPGREPAEVEGR